jgi:hypothetical protein
MSTIQSSTEHLTLNADGAGKEIKFQANGVEKASISSAGAFTSTSIDATKLSGNLPAIDGSALTGMPAGGKVLQVVYGTANSVQQTTSTSPVDTDLYVDITPSSTSSKIVITYTGVGDNEGSGRSLGATLYRDATNLYSGFGLSRVYANGTRILADVSAVSLDTPNTTSTIRYRVKFFSGNGYSVRWYNNHQTIVAMEIGA